MYNQLKVPPYQNWWWRRRGINGVDNSPLDPSDLSPTHHFSEASPVITNLNWEDIVGGETLTTGSAFSYFSFTQNSLTYFEADGGFSTRLNTAADFFDANEKDFSFIMVHKTRVAGNTATKEMFRVHGDVANATWIVYRNASLKAEHWIRDDSGNIMSVAESGVVNDNVWRISIMTVSQATGAGELHVYNLDGTHLSDSDASWVKSNYNSVGTSCYQTGGVGVNAIWVGQAEIIYYRDKILTLNEANRIGSFLASKWGLTWVENT